MYVLLKFPIKLLRFGRIRHEHILENHYLQSMIFDLLVTFPPHQGIFFLFSYVFLQFIELFFLTSYIISLLFKLSLLDLYLESWSTSESCIITLSLSRPSLHEQFVRFQTFYKKPDHLPYT